MQRHPNTYYIQGLANGNDQVLSEIYDQFLPLVKRFVCNEGGNDADAEDVFSQVLMQLFARIKVRPFEISSTFEGYLFVACKHTWRKHFNKKIQIRGTRRDYHELHRANEAEELARAVLEREKWELFHEKFQELSENCRRILELHLEKKSGREIMETLGYASETTVRQRIFKCKSSLTKKIRTDGRYHT